ncbi:MAG TPA: hypothetical protein VFP53_04325 [Sphingomicrobium sp.]|nr:hypothetical protein [Sphingomicrobium sp.]
MSLLWAYFWPVVGFGLLSGIVAAVIALRKRRWSLVAAGLVVAFAGVAAWHGPLGAADRLTFAVETSARTTLDYFEMTAVEAHLHRDPLSRRLILSGPADSFQRGELVRVMSKIPGVGRASWSRGSGLPLILEALIACAAGFILGLLLAYAVELRRRHNAQWKW